MWQLRGCWKGRTAVTLLTLHHFGKLLCITLADDVLTRYVIENTPTSVDTSTFVTSLMCSTRNLLLEGRVQLKRGLQHQDRHIFLFNDILVVAKVKNTHLKTKNNVKLSYLWTSSCVEEVGEGNTNTLTSFVLGWPTINYVATFSTHEQKEKWLCLLQRNINLEKQKDLPKTIPLRIVVKDMGNCAYSKTITITNTDTANEVIAMALQLLGINGSERDYQLWVSSAKEEAPYPLIGHESPYGIKMSHVRDAVLLIQGSKGSASSLDFQEESLLAEQLSRDLRCQFTLKPSRPALSQPLTGQKPSFRRRRSVLNWAFWRDPQMDNPPGSPTDPGPGKLFGVSLEDVCEDDNLPKPVLEMLSFLHEKGPLTKGIFRQSANAKSCRELKEKLNSGAEVQLDCESVFVTASVLKDFLRNIPGSIFSSDLFDKWICVMDRGNDEEKIIGVQRLIDHLPRANIVLLRYLFGLLHSIKLQSASNQMTAFNLAVCIAPSVLWPPASSGPELESECTKKVSLLVQFLIENCCRIFGDEITSLFEDISIKCDSREDVPGITCFQLNDSSYDSLENELNDDLDSPFSIQGKKLGQNRSVDSVLTLSDCDLEQAKDEEVPRRCPPPSKPVSISVWFHRNPASRDPSKHELLHSGPCGLSPAAAADAVTSLRSHRRCSEPTIDFVDPKLTFLREGCRKKSRKASCDAVLSPSGEGYLGQLRSLQEEGQRLISQSPGMGFDVKKNKTAHRNTEKRDPRLLGDLQARQAPKSKPMAISVSFHRQPTSPDRSSRAEGRKLIGPSSVPGTEAGKRDPAPRGVEKEFLPSSPRFGVCPRTSCSSFSSPGTSPSGSSVSSQDSAFSQISEHSAFTPTDASSPVDCTFQAQRKQGGLPPDFSGLHPFPGLVASSPPRAGGHPVRGPAEAAEWPAPTQTVTLHPSTWLRSGVATLKSWSFKKKERVSRQKSGSSVRRTLGPPLGSAAEDPPGSVTPKTAGGTGPKEKARERTLASSRDAGRGRTSPFGPREAGLKSPELSTEAGQEAEGFDPTPASGQPPERPQPSSVGTDQAPCPDPSAERLGPGIIL
ncbi:rho GTPase-activating protein 20 [Tachyglossus aculeatus]|uniref:rho GTPase-activating protein 20 n=1 Tax=Tachyglossus aculeatus TaxID=9261 RepID=UPI0018F5D78B|nr:rho GTPase-activating protein 20 [Tachyglossus aculeatus]